MGPLSCQQIFNYHLGLQLAMQVREELLHLCQALIFNCIPRCWSFSPSSCRLRRAFGLYLANVGRKHKLITLPLKSSLIVNSPLVLRKS